MADASAGWKMAAIVGAGGSVINRDKLKRRLHKAQEAVELAACLVLIPVGYVVIGATMAAGPVLLTAAALHRAAVGSVAAECRIRRKGWK